MALAREQGFPQQLATGLVHWGWALAAQGEGEEGIPQIRQGLAAYRLTGAEVVRPCYLTCLAEAYGAGGQPAEGLRVLAEAVAAAHNIGERWYEAERHRLKGDLLLAVSAEHQAEAEACFQQALDVARHQQARSLGATGRHEPGPAVAVPGQARRSPRTAGTDLWLVHRGL